MKNIIGLWPNLDRAIEIAALGNLSIQVVFQDYPEGFKDYETIKNFYNRLNFNLEFVGNDGDLRVEIVKPDDYEINHSQYTWEDVNTKIHNTLNNNLFPTEYSNIACITLLNTVTKKLNYSLSEKEHIKKVASIIAKLENSTKIDTVHVAEAIQYHLPLNDDIIYSHPETKEIQFGAIKYAKDKINIKNVDDAINFLTNLKNVLVNKK